MSDRKLPPFNAVPPRAMSDRRLQGAHHAVLQCIAYHDRFSIYNGGQACWASVRTIAKETGLSVRMVNYAITDLIAWGYLLSRRISQNKRHLAIVYDDEGVVQQIAPLTAQGGATGCIGVVQQVAHESLPLKHFPEANSAEAAPRLRRSAVDKFALQDGGIADSNQCSAIVREAEAQLPSCGSPDEADRLAGILGDIEDAYDGQSGDGLGGKAKRLRDEYESLADKLRHGNGSDAHERNRLIDESLTEVRRARRKPPAQARAFGPWVGEEIQRLNVDYRAVAGPIGMTDAQIANLAVGRSCVGCVTRKKIVAVLDAIDARQMTNAEA